MLTQERLHNEILKLIDKEQREFTELLTYKKAWRELNKAINNNSEMLTVLGSITTKYNLK